MPPENIDAKPPTEAPPVSSTGADAKKDYAELAIAEVAKSNVPPPAEPSPATTPPDSQPSGAVQNSDKTGEKEAPASPTVPTEPTATAEVPWHKDERFQQFLKDKKEIDGQKETYTQALRRVEELDRALYERGISPEQFNETLEIAGLINTNPAEAWKRMQPLVQHLQQFQGETLPDDLKEMVEAGTVPLEVAKRLAAAEKQKQFAEQRQRQVTSQSSAKLVHRALDEWENSKVKTDPDYERKREMVNRTFVALSATKPWQSPEQAVVLADMAYNEVNKWAKQFIPTPQATKSLSANGASVAKQADPSKWDEVEDFVVKKFA